MTVPAPVPSVLRVAMNGVTGQMGHRQHLLRSILPLREAGGLEFPHGSRVQVEPILVGRHESKLRDLAQQSTAPLLSAARGEATGLWDPQLEEQVARADREGRIAAHQVRDFDLPVAADPLLSRGYRGDGVVDFDRIGRAVTAAGYDGVVKVEISNADIGASPTRWSPRSRTAGPPSSPLPARPTPIP